MPFDLGSLKKLFTAAFKIFGVDQAKVYAECLEKEPGNLKQVTEVLSFSKMPSFAVSLVSKYLKRKQDRWADLIMPEGDGEKLTLASIDKRDLTDQVFERMMGRVKSEQVAPRIDALLTPSLPYPPPPHDMPDGFLMAISFHTIFNFFAMPAGVVPVTTVQEGEDKWDPVKDGGDPEDMLSRGVRQAMHNSISMPMAVQIASLPYQDETVIRLLREIEEEVRFSEKNPPSS